MYHLWVTFTIIDNLLILNAVKVSSYTKCIWTSSSLIDYASLSYIKYYSHNRFNQSIWIYTLTALTTTTAEYNHYTAVLYILYCLLHQHNHHIDWFIIIIIKVFLIHWSIYFLLNIDILSKNDMVLGSTFVIISSSIWSLLSCIVTTFPLRAFWQMIYTYSLLFILSETYITYIRYHLK